MGHGKWERDGEKRMEERDRKQGGKEGAACWLSSQIALGGSPPTPARHQGGAGGAGRTFSGTLGNLDQGFSTSVRLTFGA